MKRVTQISKHLISFFRSLKESYPWIAIILAVIAFIASLAYLIIAGGSEIREIMSVKLEDATAGYVFGLALFVWFLYRQRGSG